MRVLVIGGTGFIGRHVVDSLIERGHETTVVHRGKSESVVNEKAKSLIGDRQFLVRLADDIRKLKPDVVIDMIPKTASEMWSLLRTTSGHTSRLIVVSSIDVYRAYNRLRRAEPGDPDQVPLAEGSPLRDQLFPYRGNAVDALSPAYQYEK
ncbi:MAG: NAD-dependent epimerase/dehydratase family protein, partial [Cyanobacteria bacterium]|nr:NAD-dependent epimerase/dehydratase family protein [Cyanobacteriota bacterium]